MLRPLLINFFLLVTCSGFIPDQPSIELLNPNAKSVLSDGDIYKITIDQTGIFKMDYNFIKNELGVTNIDSKDPRTIQLFSFGGGMLPEIVSNQYDSGLREHKIFIEGESDGKFDSKDYILFFSNGPDKEFFNEADGMTLVKKNIYTRVTGLLVKFGTTKGLRIESITSSILPNPTILNTYTRVHHLEDQKVNLLFGKTVTYGSGKEWYGDYFKATRKKEYTSAFNFQDIVPGSLSKIKWNFAGRSDEWTQAYLKTESAISRLDIRNTFTGDVEDDYAKESHTTLSLHLTAASTITIEYPTVSSPSEGWLNYITVNTLHPLKWADKPIYLFNADAVNKKTQFKISQVTKPLEVWNVSNEFSPFAEETIIVNNELDYFRPEGTTLEKFMVFDKAGSLNAPIKGKKIANQNLSSIAEAEAVIIYYNEQEKADQGFEKSAVKLANHRSSYSGIKTIAVPLDKIYNEFSAGVQDPTALRNFARRLYLNSPSFQFITLLGDGSFDYLDADATLANENLIPVYETDESLSPIYAFPSDDYYALLEEHEGGTDLEGDLDIAIGRIPARNVNEADILVNKIIGYDTQNSLADEWKLRVAFAADDEDSNIHLNQSEEISNAVKSKYPVFNLQKIYLDAFKQEVGAAGEIIPGCTESLNNNIYQGMLVFNYLGHGGPKGLSQEGLLRRENVNSWANKEKLPLIITATCSFCTYDDPNVASAGEDLFRSTYGGAIALFTTVRNVYSSSNKELTASVFRNLFEKDSKGKIFTLGEIMSKAKNSLSGSDRSNARKFALIGDPTQRLSIPSYSVNTVEIQSKPVSNQRQDTVRSLEKLKIKAQVVDDKGTFISTYNGIANITLYDKKSTVRTLGQTLSIAQDFEIQNSVLFKGAAEIKNGMFEIEFVIPKDIDYKYGAGKISYYTTNSDKVEASGVYSNLIIGGSLTSIKDDTPPVVKPSINHFQFKNRDLTHPNPLLLVDLFDDNGINASGNSIGHDLVATLDGKTQYVLNDFYSSTTGNFKKGLVRFPLSGLSAGLHSIKVKAWDVANNSTESNIEFIVIDSKAGTQIISLSAYPNPFSNTINIVVTHNMTSSQNNQIKYSMVNAMGQTIYQKSEVLSPASVTNLRFTAPSTAVPGVYLLTVEIVQAGKRIDSKGVKLLRIP